MGPLKIGIAGLGHVGCGLIELVERQQNLRLPGEVKITGVSARSQSRNRPVDISPYRWFDDAATLAEDPDVDVFVELMGGSDGPAINPMVVGGPGLVLASIWVLVDICNGPVWSWGGSGCFSVGPG